MADRPTLLPDHVIHWRDDERDRQRSAQVHRLNVERSNDKPRPTWRRRTIMGIAIGSTGYLIASCFFDQRLHRPKIERHRFRFDHLPPK
jgi:hypothetical protein